MQNTTTNPITGNSSSLKEEKHTAIAMPKIKLGSETSLHKNEKQKFSLARRILKFLLMALTGKILKRHQAEGTKSPEKSAIMLADIQSAKPIIATLSPITTVPAASGNYSGSENIARRIAEQQFNTMDVSQSTRN